MPRNFIFSLIFVISCLLYITLTIGVNLLQSDAIVNDVQIIAFNGTFAVGLKELSRRWWRFGIKELSLQHIKIRRYE